MSYRPRKCAIPPRNLRFCAIRVTFPRWVARQPPKWLGSEGVPPSCAPGLIPIRYFRLSGAESPGQGGNGQPLTVLGSLARACNRGPGSSGTCREGHGTVHSWRWSTSTRSSTPATGARLGVPGSRRSVATAVGRRPASPMPSATSACTARLELRRIFASAPSS